MYTAYIRASRGRLHDVCRVYTNPKRNICVLHLQHRTFSDVSLTPDIVTLVPDDCTNSISALSDTDIQVCQIPQTNLHQCSAQLCPLLISHPSPLTCVSTHASSRVHLIPPTSDELLLLRVRTHQRIPIIPIDRLAHLSQSVYDVVGSHNLFTSY
jgi:hypothetical protein